MSNKEYVDANADIKNACKRERKFQDAKSAELRQVHQVLDAEDLSEDEKYVMLVSELGFGRQRAQELVYGRRRTEWKK
jgi:hypothetical protein